MAIELVQGERGPTGQTRNLQSASAAAKTLTFDLSISGLAVGEILEVSGDTNQPTNNGRFTVTDISAAPTYGVEPAPTLQAVASGTGRQKTTSTIITATGGASPAITGFTAPDIVDAATANFITDRVVPGQRVVIAGSGGPADGATQNDGGFFVEQVVSATRLRVVPLIGSPTIAGVAAAGTVQVRAGGHEVIFVNETGTHSWETIRANAVARPLGGGNSSAWTGATLLQRLRTSVAVGVERDTYVARVINVVQVESDAAQAITFDSERQDIVNALMDATLIPRFTTVDTGSATGTQVVNIGSNPGVSEVSADDGSAWLGMLPFSGQVRAGTNIFGSYVRSGSAAARLSGNIDDVMRTSIFPHGIDYAGGAGTTWDVTELFLASDAAGIGALVTQGALTQSRNLFFNKSAGAMGLVFNTSQVIVEGVFLSDTVPSPAFTVFNFVSVGDVTMLNPQEDYTLARLFLVSTATDGGQVQYTYNPRFVKRDATTGAPVAIPGLTVRIFEREVGGGEVLLGTWTSAASGRLEGIEPDGRDGINLRVRRRAVGPVDTDFQHRIVAEGGNFRKFEQSVELSARFDGDVPVDLIYTDFEGESGAMVS